MENKEMKIDTGFYSRSIFENSLITSQILSFLSLPDIKNYRLVSKSWSRQGLSSLRRESFMKTNLQTLIPYMKFMEENDEIFVHSNFTICHDTNYADSSERKETILRFFKILKEHYVGVKVRFLRVIMGSSDLAFLRNVLQLMPDLTNLEIIVGQNAKVGKNSVVTNVENSEITNVANSALPKITESSLKSVAFIFANISNKQAKEVMGPLFATFFASIPKKLEKIEILDKSKKSVIGGNVLLRMGQWQLKKLRNVQLMYSGSNALQQLGLGFYGGLSILKVGVVSWSDLPLLRAVLTNQAGSLRIFEVEVSTKTSLRSNTRCTQIASSFDIPILPQLRKLVYAVGKLPIHLLSGSRWCGSGVSRHYDALGKLENLSFLDYMNISQIIEGGDSTFAKKFPILTDLELRLCGDYNGFHNIFFSNVGENVKILQVKNFSMELPNWGDKKEFDSLMGRVLRIFPNIDYPRFEK